MADAPTLNSQARRHPATISPDAKASAILAHSAAVEKDALDASRAMQEHAQIVYRGIKATSKIPGSIDKLALARRLRKQILRQAASFEDAAKSARTFRSLWLGALGDPGSIKNRERRAIDIDA